MNRRRLAAFVGVLALTAGTFVWSSGPGFAVHDTGMFELDGNIVHNDANTPPYDWASLFDASGNRLITPDPDNGPLLASVFVSDRATPDSTYFESNKDIESIQNDWACGPINNPQNKDDIQNAYAALVQIPANAPDNAGHTVLYLGSERDTANGTAFAGFWLFKDKNVGCTPPGEFTGQHLDGDILVVSDYTNGGGTQDVSVYRWTGNDATGSPVLQASFNGGVCGSGGIDNACAIANSAAVTSPWLPTSHVTNAFVEAGIDLTALLGQAGGCFTTFMAETRSSDQLTATLKDYAGGQFNTCPQPPVTTTATPGGSTVVPGSAQHDDATVSAVGNRPVPTGSVSFFLCAPAQVTGAGCPTGGTQVGGAVALNAGSASSANASGAATTPIGKYCWRAEYTPDAASTGIYLANSHTNATTECFTVVHASPTLTTQISVTGTEPGTLGLTTLGDTATLTGFAGSVAGETITFNLYGPFAVGVTPVCSGQPVFTTTGALTAGGVATTSTTYIPTASGTYVWQASYSGNTLNDPATHACNQDAEKTTVIGATISVDKAANPIGPVSAGDTIGFDITVSNVGNVSALGASVTDPLPAGGALNWSVSPAYPGCAITGAVGSQVLTCDLGTVNGGSTLPVIHVTSATSPLDCGLINNTATLTTTNGSGGTDGASVTVQCPAVNLTKVADAATVDAGSQIGYTVTASNSNAAGTGTAHGVTISDPLPAGSGVNWSIQSQTAAACSITGAVGSQVLSCAIGDLAAGASYSVHVVSGTAFASCAAYPNTATLTATNSATLTANATTTVQCPNLSLTKTADAVTADAGDEIGFTVTASNSNAAGTGTAHGVTIADPLPAGSGLDWSILSQTGAACSVTGAVGAEVLSCTIGDLAPGASYSVHVVSGTAFASCGAYPNTATLNATNHPALTANATTTVRCPNLTLTKTADAVTVDAGDQIGFTVTIGNSGTPGTGTAPDVDITDALPAGPGIDWSIQTGPVFCSIQGAPPAETLVCGGFGLTPGLSIAVHVVSNTAFASCATYPNTATATATNHPTLQASASTTVQCPNLFLVKLADAGPVDAGSQIGFTVRVTNSDAPGTGTATGVVLNDPLPVGPGIDWSLDYGPAICTIDGAPPAETLVCTAFELAPGAFYEVHVSSNTEFASCATYPNTASVTATNHPALQAQDSITVQCPGLETTKTADDAAVSAGSPIGFTVTVHNNGPGTAKSVTIGDPLPAGDGIVWVIDPAYAGPGTCAVNGAPPTQTLDCALGDMAANATATVHITSSTAFVSCGVYDNTATASATNSPSVPSQEATTRVNCPDPSLTKEADSDAVSAGTPIGFTITASNGDDPNTGTAVGMVINDPLPAGPGIDWSIESGPGNCSIEGATPNQVLVCTSFDLEPGESLVVHIVSATEFASCGLYDNTATLTVENGPVTPPVVDLAVQALIPFTGSDSIQVNCPALVMSKTADDADVALGDPIGFTITVSNTGPGTAFGVTLHDPLPPAPGVHWTIDPDYAGPGACAITGPDDNQTLDCDLGDLAAEAAASVHILSGTTEDSCGIFLNTVSLTADNHPPLEANARTNVVCAAPEAPPVHTPAATGAPVEGQLGWATVLLVAGLLFLMLGSTRFRRVRREH